MKTNYEISVEGFMTRDIQEKHPLTETSDPIELIKKLIKIAKDTQIIPVYRLRAIEFQGNLFLKDKNGN